MRNRGTVMTTALVVVLLGGCATTDEGRTKAEGAGAGAVIGGLLGYLVDGSRGAAVGAAIGAGAGFVVGNEIAKRKQEYASTEDFLDGEIARVDEFNQTTTAYNASVRRDLVRLEHEAETLRAQYQAGGVRKEGLQAKRGELQQQLATSKKLEQTLASELKVQEAILAEQRESRPANDPYIVRLEREVRALEANLETLREGSTQLARIDQRLSV